MGFLKDLYYITRETRMVPRMLLKTRVLMMEGDQCHWKMGVAASIGQDDMSLWYVQWLFPSPWCFSINICLGRPLWWWSILGKKLKV